MSDFDRNPNRDPNRDRNFDRPMDPNRDRTVRTDQEVRAEREKVSATVVYVPKHGDPLETTWGGKRFVAGQAVTINDPNMIEQARSNPHFNVDSEDKAKDAAAASEKAAAETEEANHRKLELDGEAIKVRQDQETAELEARHKREQDHYSARVASAEKARNPDRNANRDRGRNPDGSRTDTDVGGPYNGPDRSLDPDADRNPDGSPRQYTQAPQNTQRDH